MAPYSDVIREHLRRCFPLAIVLFLYGPGCTHSEGPTRPGVSNSIAVTWRNAVAEDFSSFAGLAADDSRLYALVGSDVAAYNIGTGTRAWRASRPPGGPTNVVSVPGRVLTASRAAVAFDAASGAEIWRFSPDTVARAISTADERAYYIGTDSRQVIALDLAAGQVIWSREVLPRGAYRAVVVDVVVHGDTLYTSLLEETSPTGHLKRGWIVALDRYTGREHWRYVNERAGKAHDAGRHAVAGRMLLVNDLNGGAIIGIDRFTGRDVWRYVGPADLFGAWDIFSVADGVAYLASNDTHVYALDPETGHIHWKTQLKGSANSSAVCGDYVFAAAGSLHKLRRSDGKEVASLFLERDGTVGSEWVRSRLLAHGDRVYFVGNKAVYAVSCG